MEPKSLLEWHEVLDQYVGFLASFWVLGAIGFRYALLRESKSDKAASAAGFGAVGAALGAIAFVESLLKRAESKHQSLAEAMHAAGLVGMVQVFTLAALLLAFALAWRRQAVGWPLAAIAAAAFALRNLFTGKLGGMINPLHVIGASLWIGTLFVLVASGISLALRPAVTSDERERSVAQMVHRFSTLALASASLLVVTGVWTAWTHLEPLSALWTTPYGYALCVKLVLVAIVAGLGAWNWRRVGPSLGIEGGAMKIRRTAMTELVFAALVLLATAILVSLPSPKRAGPPRAPEGQHEHASARASSS